MNEAGAQALAHGPSRTGYRGGGAHGAGGSPDSDVAGVSSGPEMDAASALRSGACGLWWGAACSLPLRFSDPSHVPSCLHRRSVPNAPQCLRWFLCWSKINVALTVPKWTGGPSGLPPSGPGFHFPLAVRVETLEGSFSIPFSHVAVLFFPDQLGDLITVSQPER